MLRFFFRVYKFFVRNIAWPLGCFLGKVYLNGVGVSYGKNIKIYGLPTISMCKGSSIEIGNNAVLRSQSKGNAIGVNHEVILRASTTKAKIIIGDDFGMSGGAICAVDKVEIGNNVMVGANVVISDNDFHGVRVDDRHKPAEQLPSKPVTINDGVWLGADVYICKGVTIGKNVVVGAKSVVTKSIPENSLVAGIPAKVIAVIENT